MASRIRFSLLILVLFFVVSACSSPASESDPPLGLGAPVQAGISVLVPGDVQYVAIGDSLQLTAAANPEQSVQPAFSWSIEAGPASIDPDTGLVTVTGYGKILARASLTDSSGVVGDAVIVGVPAEPQFTIDYISARTREAVTPAQEYSTDGGSTWIKGSGATIGLVAGQKIMFRVAAAGTVFAGVPQTLVVDQAAAPKAPQFDIDYFNDRTSSVISAAYQYSFNGGATWTTGAVDRVKLLNGQEIRIRTAEAGLVPPGEAQVMTFIKLPEHYFKLSAGTITDYNPAGGTNVIIPSVINGIAVTSIGPNAFLGNGLKSVVIPDSVTNIGDGAFYFNSLTSVTLGKSIKTIGPGAFASNSLTQVTIPDSVTNIGMAAFDLTPDKIKLGKGFTSCFLASNGVINGMICAASPNLVIPTAVRGAAITEIGDYTFYGAGLLSVSLPSGVKCIGNGAFEDNRLSSIAFPASLEIIGTEAFANNMLTSLTIPASVRSIGEGAFTEPNRLTKIVMQGDDTAVAMSILSSDKTHFTMMYYQYGKGTYTGTQVGTWSYGR